MKALISLFLSLVLLGPLFASVDSLPPRSLVSRMIDVREKFAPPAKAMRWAVETSPAAMAWTFDIARVEGMLEKALMRAEDGSYHLRRSASGTNDSSRARSAAALAYVNKVIADWAVLQLDAKFERCDAQTIKSLAGYRVDMDPDFWQKFAVLTKKGMFGGGAAKVGGWISAWKLMDRIYLLLTSDLGSEGCPRDYQFVMWDGVKDWPIAGFDSFPDAARVQVALRVVKVPAAANNLAALLHARDANRRIYMPEYVESLLRRSAAGGCETAFYNLGVLMEEQGDVEQAKAFFSRGQ